MANLGGKFRRKMLGISKTAINFSSLGFQHTDHVITAHLEKVVESFTYGYHLALESPTNAILAQNLNSLSKAWRGFGYEGAGMAITLIDYLTPWPRHRFASFLKNEGRNHIYMLHVGVGWAWARLPWLKLLLTSHLTKFHPLYRWLILDGFGFHEGFFQSQRHYGKGFVQKGLKGYQINAFAQGLGRSLWFVKGADATEIARTVDSFPHNLRGDIWSGVGLACAYAGGLQENKIADVSRLAGAFHPALAQGVCFAAQARQLAGNQAEHTNLACQIICQMDSEKAASLPEIESKALADSEKLPAYEIWRQRIQSHFI